MIPVWIFTAISALLLASTAGYFSIIGLSSLYSAAAVSIIIMGISIEIGKISATFWLHRNIKKAPKLLSGIITVLIFLAMSITSGGTYGFLTKGHLDQKVPIIETLLQIKQIDQQISNNSSLIVREQVRLKQLNELIQTLINYDKISGPSGARSVRESQRPDRINIQRTIDAAYSRNEKLNKMKMPLSTRVKQTEAKLGPVKYLSLLFNTNIKNTIIYFTLLIVLLLDPFAILLIIATSVSYDNWKQQIYKRKKESNSKYINKQKKDLPNMNNTKKNNDAVSDNVLNNTVSDNILNDTVSDNVLNDISPEELSLFLEDPQVQDELLDDPELFHEVKKIVDSNIDGHTYKYGATQKKQKG